MSKYSQNIRVINGMNVEDFFGEVIGPMAASIMQKILYKYLQTEGVGMTGPELKMVQFAIERSYGAAKRQVEVTNINEHEIVVDKLEGVDAATLRLLASTNAKRAEDR